MVNVLPDPFVGIRRTHYSVRHGNEIINSIRTQSHLSARTQSMLPFPYWTHALRVAVLCWDRPPYLTHRHRILYQTCTSVSRHTWWGQPWSYVGKRGKVKFVLDFQLLKVQFMWSRIRTLAHAHRAVQSQHIPEYQSLILTIPLSSMVVFCKNGARMIIFVIVPMQRWKYGGYN